MQLIHLEPNLFHSEEISNRNLDELKKSIQENGIFNPVLATLEGKKYRIIHGAKRVEVARILSLTNIPTVLVDKTPKEVALERYFNSSNDSRLREMPKEQFKQWVKENIDA